MFERLNTPEETFNYKLGAALTMEKTVLGILEESIDNAQDEEVKTLFREHHAESQEHVRNLERVFELLGWDVDESPCPAIDGLEKEGKATVKKADDAVVDLILLQGALEVEHHEIGVYENLILSARALGRDDAVELLERSYDSDATAAKKVYALEEKLASRQPV